MENQPEEPQQCGTCRFFAPDPQIRAWGECQLKTLWSTRMQPVKAEMHACYQQFNLSSWQPIRIQSAAPPPATAARAEWVKWGQWAAGVGLVLSIMLAVLDLTIILPFLPEWIWIWGPGIALSLLALFRLSRAKEKGGG